MLDFAKCKSLTNKDIKPSIDTLVMVIKSPRKIPWFTNRIKNGYLKITAGQVGKIVGYTRDMKYVAVEFFEEIWIGHRTKISRFDNGCHKKGKMHHCAYIPYSFLTDDIAHIVLALIKDPKLSEQIEVINQYYHQKQIDDTLSWRSLIQDVENEINIKSK